MILPVELVHYKGPVSEPVRNPVLARRIGTTAKYVLYVCKYLSILNIPTGLICTCGRRSGSGDVPQHAWEAAALLDQSQ